VSEKVVSILRRIIDIILVTMLYYAATHPVSTKDTSSGVIALRSAMIVICVVIFCMNQLLRNGVVGMRWGSGSSEQNLSRLEQNGSVENDLIP